MLRRLTSKCLSAHVLPLFKCVLPPHQVGVGTRNGVVALIHSKALSYSFLIPLLQASPSAASCLTSRILSTPSTIQFFFKRSAQRSLLTPPGWNAVMGLSPTSSFGTILSLAVLVFSRGTPVVPLPSLWFSTPWSKGFRGRFQVFSSMGGTWTMAIYVAPLMISFLPWPFWRRMAHLVGSNSRTPNLSCFFRQILLTLPALSLKTSPPLLKALSFLGLQLALLIQLFAKGLRELGTRSSSIPC